MDVESLNLLSGTTGALAGTGSLLVALADRRRSSASRAIQDLLARLSIDEAALTDRILADPRLTELAAEVLDKASRTMQDDKLRAITESFARAIEAEVEDEIDQAFFIARTVLDLDVPHFTILRLMEADPQAKHWGLDELGSRYPAAGPLLPQLVGVLLRFGLLVEPPTFVGPGGVELTPLGRLVLDTARGE